MHHASFPTSPADFSSHIHKTVDFPPHIAPLRIPPILSPLTRKNTALRRLFPQWRFRTINQRKPFPLLPSIMDVILPSSVANSRGIGRVQKGLVDDTDDWSVVEHKGDRHAEHGEQVRVVYCSIQRVYNPGGRGIYEVLF